MLSTLKNEFQLKNFKLDDSEPSHFYKSQWSGNRWFYWIFKFFLLMYWFSWFIAGMILYEDTTTWWTKLTNWGVVTVMLYLISSLLLVTYGLTTSRKTRSIGQKLKTISASVTQSEETERNNNIVAARSSSDIRWLHKIVWILYEVACGVAIIITVSYWSLLDVNMNAFSINNHLINSILMIIDLSINRIPVKLLHFYHLMLFAVVFVSFSLILHGAGVTSAIYPVLDWSQNWKLALSLSVGFIFVVTPIVHFIVYGIYSVKILIVTKISSVKPSSENTYKGPTKVPPFSKTKPYTGETNAGFQV